MAKVYVYEGDYGQPEGAADFILETAKGGVIGGGATLVSDLLISKLFPTASPLVKAVLSAAVPVGAAIYMKDNNPQIAVGLAMGSLAIASYRIVASLLTQASSSGYSGYRGYAYPTLAQRGMGKAVLSEVMREGNPDFKVEVKE